MTKCKICKKRIWRIETICDKCWIENFIDPTTSNPNPINSKTHIQRVWLAKYCTAFRTTPFELANPRMKKDPCLRPYKDHKSKAQVFFMDAVMVLRFVTWLSK